MATQEIEQILNSSLPSINIGRVTLENSGGQFKYKHDPHVDYTAKDDKIGNEFVAAGLLNPKRTEGTVLKRSDSNAMKVTIGLVVKDVVTESLLSYWFKNRNIVDLLDVRVTYATDREQSNYLLRKNRTLNYENDLDIKNIPLASALEKKGFRNQSTTVDTNGNRVHRFSFDHIISVPNTIPYLAVFACCRVDLNKLFKKAPDTLQIQTDIIDQLPADLLAGNLSANVIIRDGNVSSTMPVFVDEETGLIWGGPVHQMDNGRWMSEPEHSDTSKYLTRRSMPNSQIQDFRLSSYLSDRTMEIHATRSKIQETISRNITPQTVDNLKPKSYFSEISFARDAIGQARFLFSMDYHKIIEDYTLFGGLLRKKGLINPDDLARNYCRILSLKVFRKRINGSAETGSKPYLVASTINGDTFVPLDPATMPGNFDCNQVDELIVSTDEFGGVLRSATYSRPLAQSAEKVMPSLGERLGLISPVSRLTADAPPVNRLEGEGETQDVIGTIEEVTGIKLNNGRGIRHVSGIDKSMPRVTDGYYQYRIEMVILDRTDEYIVDRLRELHTAKGFLQNFLNEITRPGLEASFTWKSDPHIDYEQEGKTLARKHSTSLEPRKVKNDINIYLKTLLLFTNETTSATFNPARPQNGDALRDQLLALINPRTPSGTYCIIGLIDELANQIGDALKIKELNTLTKFSNENTILAAVQPSTLMNYSKPTISFEIDNTFVNYFNSNVTKVSSYDFMELQNNPLNKGIKTATENEFMERISAETQRLFRTEEESLVFDINGQEFNSGDSAQFTDFSYLGPARINMPAGNSVQIIGSFPSNSGLTLAGAAATAMGLSAFGSPPDASAITSPYGGEGNFVPGGQETSIPGGDREEGNPNVPAPPEPPAPEPVYEQSARTRMVSYGVVITNTLEYVPFPFEESIDDPVTKDNQVCDTLAPTPGANPYPLFQRILQEINPNSYQFGGPFQSTGQSSIDESRRTFAYATKNPQTFFNPDRSWSPANNFLKNYRTWTPNELFRGAPHSNTLTPSQGWVSTTPNHLKSLSKPEVLPTNMFTVIQEAPVNMAAQAEVDLKFFKLDVLEVLIGYHEDQLTKPQWEPLTRLIYNEALGDTLLCRLKPYENILFGVTRDLQAEMPTLDEVFLLQPRTRQTAVAPEDLPPGLNIAAFPAQGTQFLFGDLGGVNEATFYVEPPPPRETEIRFGVKGGLSGDWDEIWETYYVNVLIPPDIPPPPRQPTTGLVGLGGLLNDFGAYGQPATSDYLLGQLGFGYGGGEVQDVGTAATAPGSRPSGECYFGESPLNCRERVARERREWQEEQDRRRDAQSDERDASRREEDEAARRRAEADAERRRRQEEQEQG